MDERLETLKRAPWTHEPMFHPPGSHPAVRRQRQQLAKLRELEAQGADAGELIEYIEVKLAEFEERESELKAHYLSLLTRYGN